MRLDRFAAIAAIAGCAVSGAVSGAPILYDITFVQTVGTTSTQSGSFFYDPVDELFSDFKITVNGLVVDFTALANSPFQDGICPAAPGGGSLGFAIMSGNTPCPTEQLWGAISANTFTLVNIFSSGEAFQANVLTIDSSIDLGAFVPAVPAQAVSAGGTFTIREAPASIPEPGTVALLCVALAGLGFLRRRRDRNRP
jgi:PEP-CTERM motif